MGAHVIVACRTKQKAEKAIEKIKSELKNVKVEMSAMKLDLLSFDSVLKFSQKFKTQFSKLDVLMNNAGILKMIGDNKFTENGFEETLQTNYLSHFL